MYGEVQLLICCEEPNYCTVRGRMIRVMGQMRLNRVSVGKADQFWCQLT